MILNQKSLREQVYDLIREELTQGKLIPGDAINLNALSEELGISKTPLRDALLQLDTEGFVTISPRRGYIQEWELCNCRDHDQLIVAFESGDRDAAIHVWRDFHWSFEAQEKYICRFYFPEDGDLCRATDKRTPAHVRRKTRSSSLHRRSFSEEDASV